MSQQHMEYDEKTDKYEAGYQDPFNALPGHKLGQRDIGRSASPGQRLALAIVSLFVLLFASMFAIGMLTHGGSFISWPIIVLLCLLVGLFCLATIVVNIVFNRAY